MGYLSTAGNLSQLTIDADLVMGAHDITLGGEAISDALGLAGIDAYQRGKVVSDIVRHVKASIGTHNSATYTKIVTITFTNGIKGTVRISWSMYTAAGGDARAILTQNGATPNGSNLGVEQQTSETSWQAKSQDIAVDIPAGESIDLWSRNAVAGRDVCMKDLAFKYDNDVSVVVTGAD